MPNWCDCELYIRGRRDEVARFLEHAQGEDDGEKTAFDFNKFIPMPPELAIEDGSLGDFGYAAFYGDAKPLLSYPWVAEAGVTTVEQLREFLRARDPQYEEMGRRYRDNKERFGYPTWYRWSIANWGTKWNACEPSVCPRRHGALIQFATAWSPPIPVVLRASQMFPKITLRLKYYEGGAGFKGIFTCRGGHIIENSESDYHGSRGG